MSVFRHEPREGAGEWIPCACNCGGRLQQFDAWGRERKYLPGHNVKAALAKK